MLACVRDMEAAPDAMAMAYVGAASMSLASGAANRLNIQHLHTTYCTQPVHRTVPSIKEKNSLPPSPSLTSLAATPQQMPPVLFQSRLLTLVREERKVLVLTPQQTSTPAIPQKSTTVLPWQTRPKTSVLERVPHGCAVWGQNQRHPHHHCKIHYSAKWTNLFRQLKKYIQTHFIHSHWVTSSSIGGDIVVYNSKQNGKLSTDPSHQLAQVYVQSKGYIGEGVNHIEPIESPNHSTVGELRLWRLRNCLCIHAARKNDSKGILFRKETMRTHQLKCFRQGNMPPFPRDEYIEPNSPIQECQRPSNYTELVSCSSPGATWSHVIHVNNCFT